MGIRQIWKTPDYSHWYIRSGFDEHWNIYRRLNSYVYTLYLIPFSGSPFNGQNERINMKTFIKITGILSVVVLMPFSMNADPLEAEDELFSDAELDQMLAPIALYPDVLLSQILMASTYPLEVVSASRWSKENSDLNGEDAVNTVSDKDWDLSVISLVAFPEVLQRMDEDLDWTRQLGDAFLAQEEDVLSSIQRLRNKAFQAGNLNTNEHLRVQRDQDVIIIEPTDVRVVYVPYYSTRVIYGPYWHWSHYPPVYWGPPVGFYSGASFYWGSGARISSGFYYSSFDWHRRHIIVVNVHRSVPRYQYRTVVQRRHYGDGVNRWRHDPKHRRGVDYRSSRIRRDFGRSSATGRFQSERLDGQQTRSDLRSRMESNRVRSELSERRPDRSADVQNRGERSGRDRNTESGRLRGSEGAVANRQRSARSERPERTGDTSVRRSQARNIPSETTINRSRERQSEARPNRAAQGEDESRSPVAGGNRDNRSAAERQRQDWRNATQVERWAGTIETRNADNNRWNNRSTIRGTRAQGRSGSQGDTSHQSRRAAR